MLTADSRLGLKAFASEARTEDSSERALAQRSVFRISTARTFALTLALDLKLFKRQPRK
jgi:hypothetical protein